MLYTEMWKLPHSQYFTDIINSVVQYTNSILQDVKTALKMFATESLHSHTTAAILILSCVVLVDGFVFSVLSLIHLDISIYELFLATIFSNG